MLVYNYCKTTRSNFHDNTIILQSAKMISIKIDESTEKSFQYDFTDLLLDPDWLASVHHCYNKWSSSV